MPQRVDCRTGFSNNRNGWKADIDTVRWGAVAINLGFNANYSAG